MRRIPSDSQEKARRVLLCGLSRFIGDMEGHSYYMVQEQCVWSLTPTNVVYRCVSGKQSWFMMRKVVRYLEFNREAVPDKA